jgi:hypothetical protein
MHPETTIQLAAMRRDELLRSGSRTYCIERIRSIRPARSIRTGGTRS